MLRERRVMEDQPQVSLGNYGKGTFTRSKG